MAQSSIAARQESEDNEGSSVDTNGATAMHNDRDKNDQHLAGEAVAMPVAKLSADEVRYQTAIQILQAMTVVPLCAETTISEEKLLDYTSDATANTISERLDANGCTCVLITDTEPSYRISKGHFHIQEMKNQPKPGKIKIFLSENHENIQIIIAKTPKISQLIKNINKDVKNTNKNSRDGGYTSSINPALCQQALHLSGYNHLMRAYAKILGFESGATLKEKFAKNKADCQQRTRKLIRQFAPQQIERLSYLSDNVRLVYKFVWEILHPIHEYVNDKKPISEEDEANLEREEEDEARQSSANGEKTTPNSFSLFNLFFSKKVPTSLTPLQISTEVSSNQVANEQKPPEVRKVSAEKPSAPCSAHSTTVPKKTLDSLQPGSKKRHYAFS